MGLSCELQPVIAFRYHAEVGPGLIENELDHIFVGWADSDPSPDPAEADAWRWMSVGGVQRSVRGNPEWYAAWFPLALHHLLAAGIPEGPEGLSTDG
jgi:isopentenyldiphosphate isomerase